MNAVSRIHPALLIFAAAVLFRGLYWSQASEYPLLYVPLLDEAYYLAEARRILAGEWTLASGFFMDPLYAWVMASVLAPGGDPTALRLMQVVVDSTSAVIVWSIGRRLWSGRAGHIAGLLYAAYPVAWFFALSLLKTTLTTGALLGFTWLLVRALRPQQGARTWLCLGLLAGIATYLRGYLVLLAPMTLLLAALLLRPWRRLAVLGGAFSAGVALLLGGVGLWHWQETGAFAALPGTAGSTLYSANHPGNPHGVYAPPEFITLNSPELLEAQFRREAERRVGAGLTPVEAADYWRDQTVAYWLSGPVVVPRLLWYKGNQLITGREIPGNQDLRIAATYAPVLVAWLPAFSLAFAMGVPGLLLGLRAEPAGLALLVPLGVVVVTGLIFYTDSRFRFPMVPFLLLGVGVLADGRWLGERRLRWLVPIAVGLLLTASITAWRPDPGGGTGWLNVATAHSRLGEFPAAEAALARVDPAARQGVRYLEARTYLALLRREYAQVLAFGRRGLALEPDNPRLLFNIGLASLATGEPGAAVRSLERALLLNPDAETARHLAEARSQAAAASR